LLSWLWRLMLHVVLSPLCLLLALAWLSLLPFFPTLLSLLLLLLLLRLLLLSWSAGAALQLLRWCWLLP
jgi:hypothetical protein